MKLHLAEDLALPLDLATQTLLVVGKRGSGKSNTCVRLAEQLFAAKIPFVAIDPTDTWYGLKSSKDGKSAGLGVYIFGGRHADLPLEPAGGQLAADVVIDNRISAVFSVKHFSGRERSRFVSDFCDRLFRRNTEPLHVFLEEAHEVAPQSIQFKGQGDEEMLGRVTRIWKLGRSSGLGGSAITQRPASLSKNITTQAEILIVHRMLGPQDVAAVREWIKYHDQSDEILAQLSTLKTGEAFFWAPDFPEEKPIGLRRVRILERETFDSSATPKAGQKHAEPKELAPVDLGAIAAAMKDTIERAKAEDPRELRKKIAELERDLRAKPAIAHIIPKPERVEVPAIAAADLARCERLITQFGAHADRIVLGLEHVSEKLHELTRKVRTAATGHPEKPAPGYVRPEARHQEAPRTRERATGGNGKIRLPIGERRILTAIAQHASPVSREQLSVLTGYKRSSRDTYLQRLREKGLIEDGHAGLVPTAHGVDALPPDFEPLPTGDALREHWIQRLPEGERRILEILIGGYPEPVDRELLSERTGYARSSRDTYLQRLSARKLVTPAGRGAVVASEELFS